MSTKSKRLYRSDKDKMIGGVAGGIAEYFNMDPTLIRFLWIIIFFAGGSGLLLYIILWIIVPAKKTTNSSDAVDEETNMSCEKKDRGGSDYVFAFFLIFLGLVFLLNTTGLITWEIWSVLLRFWPLLIIFAGLNLIVQESKVFRIIIGVISIIVFLLVFLFAIGVTTTDKLPNTMHNRFTEWLDHVEDTSRVEDEASISIEDYEDVESKTIHINMNVGQLSLVNEDSDNYLSLDAEYPTTYDTPEIIENFDEGNLDIDIDLNKRSNGFFFTTRNPPKYFLKMGQSDIPTDLAFDLGAGSADIDLNNYNIQSLDLVASAGRLNTILAEMYIEKLQLDVGAGQLNLDIKDDFDVRNDIKAKIGAGQLVVNIPEDFGYTINGNLGVGSIKLRDKDVSGLGRDLEDIKSSNYDDAEIILEFDVDVGVGQFVIN